jgi:hypothetical protein
MVGLGVLTLGSKSRCFPSATLDSSGQLLPDVFSSIDIFTISVISYH